MPNKQLIQKKLTEILKQLEFLNRIVKLKPAELFGKEENYYFAERVMERLIQAAIDINMHLLKDLSNSSPDDYHSSFTDLAKIKVLPSAFAKKIAPSTSLRNILTHEYQNIDEKKFYQALKYALTDYKTYATHIQKLLSK